MLKKTIENGYFIFTVFSSLKCNLNCPHCYLSKKDRQNSEIMNLDNLRIACEKVNDYYLNRKDLNKVDIVFYWYGGEITVLGRNYFYKASLIVKEVFKHNKYNISHIILSNLIDKDIYKWVNIFKNVCNSKVQTSYDYLMRGEKYLKNWKVNIKLLKKNNIKISVLNVVNKTMLGKEDKIYEDFINLEMDELGFLPFMKNINNMKNFGENYLTHRATMEEYSEFNINFFNLLLKNNPEKLLNIGTINHILSCYLLKDYSNVSNQTLFLLSNGDFSLPDYYNNYYTERLKVQNYTKKNYFQNGIEYLETFGNIFDESTTFEDILKSQKRELYLNKQYNLNNNIKCNSCNYDDICLMEFWKNDKIDETKECPGGKTFVTHVIDYYNNLNLENKNKIKNKLLNNTIY